MSPPSPPFSKVLIANRGEIACRIIETLTAMGIGSVAIFHETERAARFVGLAGEALQIDGETPVAAYLDAGQIVGLAKQAGAEAIHPGYGFLSENAAFAKAVPDAGLVFIGPDPASIDLMGDKIRSRRFAAEHGVPVAPSVLPTGDVDQFLKEAEAIGFPLLIKASAGGGGRGMSIVHSTEELIERSKIAASEAERYFGDGRIYAERYVERPRHIEVQVLGDGNGNVVHLFERECSIQRRFQKIIEEAPSVGLAPALREAICEAAVRLAAAANYKNAGTVEFVLAPDGTFYFLEMNTRLQVEHPVSEMITGIDLVKAQVEIAAGRPLPVAQEQISQTGHAIECRICAEVPEVGFAPSTGKVLKLRAPDGEGIRFENGLREGNAITLNFDSMLAKLVVHGPDRAAAINRTRSALHDLVLLGAETNIDYLARVVSIAPFSDGDMHTGFLEEHAEALAPEPLDAESRDTALLAAALSYREVSTLIHDAPEPYASIGAWRN